MGAAIRSHPAPSFLHNASYVSSHTSMCSKAVAVGKTLLHITSIMQTAPSLHHPFYSPQGETAHTQSLRKQSYYARVRLLWIYYLCGSIPALHQKSEREILVQGLTLRHYPPPTLQHHCGRLPGLHVITRSASSCIPSTPRGSPFLKRTVRCPYLVSSLPMHKPPTCRRLTVVTFHLIPGPPNPSAPGLPK